MKAYKGFNKDLQCTPDGKVFQYEIGKEYVEENADPCKSGFHACEYPLDCFGYYDPANSRFCEVELEEVSDKKDCDTKRCGKRIRIGAELDIKGLIKAAFEYTRERCNSSESGGDMSALTGGDMSALTGGDMSALTGGNMSALRGGIGSKFKGGMWAVFACEIRNDNYALIGMKTAVVDGETIKPDIWYVLKDGEFVEAEK